MLLDFEGPFAATSRGEGTPLASSAVGRGTGIYFWSVRLVSSYRVAYLGKTQGATRNFALRIREEVDRFRQGLDGYFDLDAFRRGVRRAVPQPASGSAELLEHLIECSPIFVAPVQSSPSELLAIESTLIRVIQAQSAETRSFLAHGGRLVRRPVSSSLELRFPDGVVVEGLDTSSR